MRRRRRRRGGGGKGGELGGEVTTVWDAEILSYCHMSAHLVIKSCVCVCGEGRGGGGGEGVGGGGEMIS